MAKNGTVVKLTTEEKTELKRKIATFSNVRQFCLANRIAAPQLEYPLLKGRCSVKTYKRLLQFKENDK